jgi:hypothetical protein
MKVKLIIVSPEVQTNEYEITLPTKIGRGHEARLKLVHPLVSRLHCELFAEGDKVMIRDLDSLNGTFVDQQRIDEDTAIPSGATVIIGTVMFRVAYGKDVDRLPPPAAKVEKTAATAGTLRNDTFQQVTKPPHDSDEPSLAPETSDEEEFSVAPLEEPVAKQPVAKQPRENGPSNKPANKNSAGNAAAGEDDDLDDFLKSIM